MRRKQAGVKPIVGCELYVCKKDDHNIERTPPEGDTYNHLLVLAENEEGYRNLAKITSEASLHGFYYKPRVSKKFLAEHSKGLIGLSGLPEGRSRRTADGREVRSRARMPPRTYREFSARIISFWRFRIRVWSRSTAFIPVFSSWKKTWACRWWRPTTATISARTMPTPRM